MNKWKIVSIVLSVSVIITICSSCKGGKPEEVKNKYTIKASELSRNVNQVSSANNKVAFKFLNYEINNNKDNNIVISSLSLNTVLSMTQNGAANKTKDEMLQALELKGIKDNTINEDYRNIISYYNSLKAANIKIADSIWIQKGFIVTDSFINTGKENYEAEVNTVDFNKKAALDAINNWISDKTAGKIKKFNDDLSGTTMALINTLYFKSKWAEPFNEKNTSKQSFYLSNGLKEEIEMMRGTISVQYLKAKNFAAVRIPYEDQSFGFYVFLPDKGVAMNELLQSMTYDYWNSCLNEFKQSEVSIRLPKFKMDYESELNDMLQSFGMKSAFEIGKADFSRISEKSNLYIDKIKQKCYIDVNEAGTEAAAATEVVMKVVAVTNPIEFTVDRPFLYAIVDNKTGLIMFMGKVQKP